MVPQYQGFKKSKTKSTNFKFFEYVNSDYNAWVNP